MIIPPWIAMLAGTLAGMVASGWGIAMPWGRVYRGVMTTAAAESGFNPAAIGDNGASVGILQYNDVRSDLIGIQGWRESAWWSGYAVARYLRITRARIATLRPGTAGLRAWRAAWTAGDPDITQRGEVPGLGEISARAWARYGKTAWIFTAIQVAILLLLLLLLPLTIPAIALVVLGGWLRG